MSVYYAMKLTARDAHLQPQFHKNVCQQCLRSENLAGIWPAGFALRVTENRWMSSDGFFQIVNE